MVVLSKLLDIILHVDKYLGTLLSVVGSWTYLLLFFIIFAETGFVLTPFLPGDSLLFGIGAFAAQGYFSLLLILILLCGAAIIGDSMNYWIGAHVGKRLLAGNHRFIKPGHIEKTKLFYEKHGKKTIILARFIPIVRTFAPFVAGIGKMQYPVFLLYNITGGILWVSLFILAGYLFGNIPFVQKNFGVFIIGIIIASFMPMVVEVVKHILNKKKKSKETINTEIEKIEH
ncbi:VTT domain-containing protein [Candidatus Woesearchaeota archaeon]|nr:VTT domain-containing protein [Candidatus Woesearchaeota archaeon]